LKSNPSLMTKQPVPQSTSWYSLLYFPPKQRKYLSKILRLFLISVAQTYIFLLSLRSSISQKFICCTTGLRDQFSYRIYHVPFQLSLVLYQTPSTSTPYLILDSHTVLSPSMHI
jgi:hypothetical protein